jgi:hypothetical protein
VSGQLHAPAVLLPEKTAPGTHYIGDWVGLSYGKERNLSSIPEIQPRCLGHSALSVLVIPTELSLLAPCK